MRERALAQDRASVPRLMFSLFKCVTSNNLRPRRLFVCLFVFCLFVCLFREGSRVWLVTATYSVPKGCSVAQLDTAETGWLW